MATKAELVAQLNAGIISDKDGDNLDNFIRNLLDLTSPERVFEILVTQAGTDAPTVIILQNGFEDLDPDFAHVKTRVLEGKYRITLPEGAFPDGDKVSVYVGTSLDNASVHVVPPATDDEFIDIWSFLENALSDGVMTKATIRICVKP